MVGKVAIWSTYLLTIGCMLIFHNRLYPNDVLSLVASVVLIAAGGVIALAGEKALGESHTTLPEARKLVTRGIYAKIRHPMYTGVQLVFWGLSLWLASLVGFVLSLALVLPLHIWRAKAEERLLIEIFGDEYLQYKSRTLF